MHSRLNLAACVLALFAASACSRPQSDDGVPKLKYKLNGPLIPARMTMVTAWDFPQNPLTDKSLDTSKLSKEIQLGYRLFTNTPAEAERFVPGAVSCNNCHLMRASASGRCHSSPSRGCSLSTTAARAG